MKDTCRIEPNKVRLTVQISAGHIVTSVRAYRTSYDDEFIKKSILQPGPLALTTLSVEQLQQQLQPVFENINSQVSLDFTFYRDSLQNVLKDTHVLSDDTELSTTDREYFMSLLNIQAAYTLRLAHEKLRELVQDDLMQGFVDNESYENLD